MRQEIGGNKNHSTFNPYIGATASSPVIGRGNNTDGGGVIYFNQPTYTHSETHLQNEGDWISLGTMVQLDTVVSSMSIDTFDEMVWLGYSNVCIMEIYICTKKCTLNWREREREKKHIYSLIICVCVCFS